MAKFCDTLVFKKDACPAECKVCVDACAKRNKGDNLGPVMKVLESKEKGKHGIATCYQCGEPKCMEACPSEAITKGEDGLVKIDAEQCTGCEACIEACPYGMMFFNEEKQLANKCEQCGGSPACVEACPYEVASFAKSKPVYMMIQGKKDIIQRGNNLCQGCGPDLALRYMLKVTGDKNLLLQTAMGCPHLTVQAAMTATISSLLPSVPALMTGISRYYRKIGKEYMFIGFLGDGTTCDIAFQALSAAGERGEKFIYTCYDNEAYENTGIQKSSTTPYGAWTTTTQVGKNGRGNVKSVQKNVALLMAMQRLPYVATATISDLEDFGKKMKKALEYVKDGMVYIHILTPCGTGWRAKEDETIELARRAVETNYFPLWEAVHGKLHITHKVKHPRPATDFVKMQARFKHMNAEELVEFQKRVDDSFAIINALDKGNY
ncbi:MAG: thiamine pyrophosphate-dependent enzyme [Chloroflexi bacterium]|nr:thiamine pyrophosphate-dependent enzyme [Chloroflexota bacterium]